MTIDEICEIAGMDWNYQRNKLKRTKHSTINVLLSKNYPIYSFNANKQPIMCESYGSRLVDAIQLTYKERIHTMDYTSNNYAIICGDSMLPDKRAVLALDFDFYNNNPDNYHIQFMNEIYQELMSIYQTSDTNEEDIHKLIPGFATSSTEGNYNMFIEFDFKGPEGSLLYNRDLYIAYCHNIIQKAKCNKIVIDHLEVALSDCYQVLPPSETISKKTQQPNPRKYLSNQLFYTIQSTNDPIYQLLIKIVDKHDEMQQNKMKERAQQQTSFAPESNEEQIKKATYYIQEGLKENLFSKYPERKDWISLGYAIKCIFGEADGLDAFLRISQQWEDYDESQDDDIVENFNSLNIGSTDVNFSIGRIYNQMKSNDKEKAKKIMSTYYRTILQPAKKQDSTEIDPTIPIIEKNTLSNMTDMAFEITPILRPILRFIEKKKDQYWYVNNSKDNLWYQTYSVNLIISETCQILINNSSLIHKKKYEDEKNQLNMINKETEKERYQQQEQLVEKCRKNVSDWGKAKNNFSKKNMVNDVKENLKTLLRDPSFEDQLDLHPKKFAFQNGMLDIKTNTLSDGILPEHYVTQVLPIHYTSDVDETKKAELLKEIKKIANNNDDDMEYLLSCLGFILLGTPKELKSIYFWIDKAECTDKNEKAGNNGKTLLIVIISESFRIYTYKTKKTYLEENNQNIHKQQVPMTKKRLVWCDEGTTKYVNTELIKEISTGQRQECSVMYGNAVELDITYKYVGLSNSSPIINPAVQDTAVFNRFVEATFLSKFYTNGEITQDDPVNLKFVGINNFQEYMLSNYTLEIIQLMVEYGQKFLIKKCLPDIPANFKAGLEETVMCNNPFRIWIENHCEECPGAKVADQVLQSMYNMSIKRINLSEKEFRDRMAKLGYKFERYLSCGLKPGYTKESPLYIRGGYKGLRLIEHQTKKDEDDNSDLNEPPLKKQCQRNENRSSTPGHENLDDENDF
jgi:phage/plasmid-associated DNA primase